MITMLCKKSLTYLENSEIIDAIYAIADYGCITNRGWRTVSYTDVDRCIERARAIGINYDSFLKIEAVLKEYSTERFGVMKVKETASPFFFKAVSRRFTKINIRTNLHIPKLYHCFWQN